MIYTVYRTTNILDNKYYIGVHKTANPDDDYLGSGTYLKRAIEKHGREYFRKEILHIVETRTEAYSLEAKLITTEIIADDMCYNIKLGGKGGFDYLNTGLMINHRNKSEKYKKSVIQSGKNNHKKGLVGIKARDPDWKLATATILKFGGKKNIGTTGKKFSSETRIKMSNSGKGENNSQFGTIWITDGIINKKCKRGDTIPYGWRAGKTSKINK